MWLCFLALHLTGHVGCSLVLRKSLLSGIDRWTLATALQTGMVIPILFLAFIRPPSLSAYDARTVALIALATLLITALHIANVKALQYLEASVYTVLYNFRIPLTTVLGVIFLHEAWVWLRVLGGLLIMAAIFIVRQKGERALTARGLRWGISAGLIVSLSTMTEKIIVQDIGFIDYAVPAMIASAALMWAVLLFRRNSANLKVLVSREVVSIMALRTISAHGFTLALAAGGLLSVTNYISSLGVVLIVVLGVLLLGERDCLRQKIIATSLAALGLTLIGIASLSC